MIAKLGMAAVVIVHMVYSNADALSLRKKRSGAKLENTSLSAGVFLGSAYGIYHAHNSGTESVSFAITYEKPLRKES